MEKASVMKLNVGGEIFRPYYATLEASSYFRNLQSKMIPQPNAITVYQPTSVCHFIDRDPEVFRDILHYLKTWEVNSSDKHYLTILQNEADFYGFYDLVKRIDQMLSVAALDDKLFSERYESREAKHLPVDFGTIRLDSPTETLVQTFRYGCWPGHEESKIVLVHLNVGGKRFTSLYSTLARSKYHHDLIQDHSEKLEGQESLFIDRDGNLFRQILFYLRTGLIWPSNEEDIKKLLCEARLYQCRDLMNVLQLELEKLQLSQQAPSKIGLDFIDLKKMFNENKSMYTLIKKTGDTVEAYSVVDYINVFSQNEYKDKRCVHGRDDCGCHYYPKLVLVPQQQKHQ
ncbi:hypothetical protein MBANPS3_010092 [Mucor bainieri]